LREKKTCNNFAELRRTSAAKLRTALIIKKISAVFDSIEVNMQDLKVYIVIEDPNTRQDVSIKGNFEVLRAFLSGVGTLEIQDLTSPNVAQDATPKRKPLSLATLPKTAKGAVT
jgi:hypothetical protein